MIRDIKLMVPGPVEVSYEVRQQMASVQVAHYAQEAIDIYNSCVEKLRPIFGVENNADLFIMPGSGSAALDACIGTLVRRGEKVLTATNGMFSARLKTQAQSYGARTVEVSAEEGRAVTAPMIEDAVKKNPDCKAILAVHLETSTGALNPIGEIGVVAKEYDIPLVVDAVSSIGTQPFQMDEWNVSLCGASPTKGLETPPGLGIAVVSKRGWETIGRKEPSHTGWYSDLNTWKEVAETNVIRKGVVYPLYVTMPVNNMRALHQSLRAVEEEGLEQRFARHALMASVTQAGMRNLGFDDFPPEGYRANGVTVMNNTLGIDVAQLIEFLKETYATEIGNGLCDLHNKIVRIGHIGQTATLDCVVPVLFGIEHFLRKKGMQVPVGASLAGIQ